MPCDDFFLSHKDKYTVLNHKQDKNTLNKLNLALKTFSKQFLYTK